MIPTSGRIAPLNACLRSLAAQENPNFEYEILVTCNPGSPGVAALVGAYQDRGLIVQYCPIETLGANRARNYGAQRAKGRYLLFLDDDTALPDPRFMCRLQERLGGHRAEVALGGYYLSPRGVSLAARVYNCAANLWMMKSLRTPRQRPIMVGGCTLIDRLVFLEVGGFEVARNGAAEELGLSHRVQARGHRVVLSPKISVHHHFQGGWTRLYGNAFRHGQVKPGVEEGRLDSIPSRQVISLLRRGQALDRSLGASRRAKLLIPGLAAYYFVVLTGSAFGRWVSRKPVDEGLLPEAVAPRSGPEL